MDDLSEGLPDGKCVSLYCDELISGDDMQAWIKGYVERGLRNGINAVNYIYRKIRHKILP